MTIKMLIVIFVKEEKTNIYTFEFPQEHPAASVHFRSFTKILALAAFLKRNFPSVDAR